jgi:hypothetical protein
VTIRPKRGGREKEGREGRKKFEMKLKKVMIRMVKGKKSEFRDENWRY